MGNRGICYLSFWRTKMLFKFMFKRIQTENRSVCVIKK